MALTWLFVASSTALVAALAPLRCIICARRHDQHREIDHEHLWLDDKEGLS
jgi:hypothetical protein